MPRNPKVTQEQVDRMVALYESGVSLRGVAKELHTSNDVIARHLRERGVEIRRAGGPQRVTDDQLERWKALYSDGLTCREIARQEGVHYVTVGKKLRAAGLAPVQGGRNRQKREFTDAEMSEMIAMSRAGRSRDAIAKQLASSQNVVQRVLASVGEHPIERARGARGAEHGSWRGGRVPTGDGYVAVVVAPDDPLAVMRNRQGYVLEHRLVMARHLGRPLTRHETVHHRNGVRDANQIENLELRRGSHGKHQAYRCKACGSLDVEPLTAA